jgi:SnoaL-like domain
MGTGLTYADVVAGVGAAMASYTHALDDGRTNDLVATFCPDGTCDMPGLGHHTGHEALKKAYERFAPVVPQRHLVLNTHVTEWGADEARATSDVVLLVKGELGWAVQVVGRYHDILHRDRDAWRFHSRVAEFVT